LGPMSAVTAPAGRAKVASSSTTRVP
jgi:hypothetical protein